MKRLGLAFFLAVCCALTMAPAGDQRKARDAQQKAQDAQCRESKTTLLREASKVATDRSVGCRADSECVLVDTSLSCQDGCPFAILASARGDYLEALKAKDASLCASANKNCRVGLICAPTQGAECVQGRCLVKLKGVKLGTPASTKKQ